VEYGYSQDLIFENTDKSVRLFSAPEKLSNYEVVNGRMPIKEKEVALDYQLQADHQIGEQVNFEQSDQADLKQTAYKIVGFVKASEITETTGLGQTTVGSGTLNSYGVITKDNFDMADYTIARLSFSDTKNLDPYSDKYDSLIRDHQQSLDHLFKKQD